MLPSLFSLVAFAGLVVAGSVPHTRRQAITCTPLGSPGTLNLTSLADAFLPMDTPVTLGVGGPSSPYPGQLQSGLQDTFLFQSCTSSVIQEPPSTVDGTVYFYG
jgi:hypothetical protein